MLAKSRGEDLDTVTVIERCGTYVAAQRCYRVTASDVAASGGYEIESARVALTLLATAVQGAMEVTNDGQIVFVFPKDCRRILRNRRSPHDSLLERTRAITATLARAMFGLLLLASFALVRPLFEMTFRDGEERNARHSRVSLRRELSYLQASVLNQLDSSSHASPGSSVADASLIMTCFSFLFGGHNPNSNLEDEQMAAIATAIRDNRGAVTVEQVAPFLLDPEATQTQDVAGDSMTVEFCMLPILARFEGRPHVIEGGHIIYLFPDLLPTTARVTPQAPALVKGLGQLFKRVMGPGARDSLEEKQVPFMPPAHRRQLERVLMVVAVNWVGLVLMGAALGPLQLSLRVADRVGTLLVINVVYGLLLVNGLGYILIPAFRGIRLLLTNSAITRRNAVRRAHAEALLRPTRDVALKLKAAEGLAYHTEAIRDSDVYYTTAKTLLEQSETHDPQREAWDQALLRRTRPPS